MAWRAPAVEAVLGVPVDENNLSTDVLQHVVDIAAREGEQLDFKSKPHLSETGPSTAPSPRGGVPEKGWSAEQEFAKDVCAFANHVGGLLLVGVRDEEEVAVEVMDPPVTDPGALEQRLRQALVNYAAPVPRFQCIPIPAASGGFYLAIVVPASMTAPHAVRGASSNPKRPLHYPVRDGADTRWLLEHEVADRYRARAATRDERIALREDVVERGVEALARAPGRVSSRHDPLHSTVGAAPAVADGSDKARTTSATNAVDRNRGRCRRKGFHRPAVWATGLPVEMVPLVMGHLPSCSTVAIGNA